MNHERPLVHSLVMCDFAWPDRSTRKFTLIGTFNRIGGLQFPSHYGPIAVYLAMSHWTAEQDLRLQLAKDSVNVVAKMPPIKVPKYEPNRVIEFGLNLPPIPLAEPGKYSIQVIVGDELIHEFPFEVVLRQPPTQAVGGQDA